ncbi:MAG: hypothetical protein ACJZ2K_02940 [Candidatus Poseidoniaceae archaeon]
METMKRVILISILMFCMFVPMNAQAQGALVGVELECTQQTIGINVHPEQNTPVDVNCVVKNTGSVSETISLDSEVEGNSFALSLSESSFDLDAGEDANFVATFSASPRISVISEDYTITARVDSWGQDPFNIPAFDPSNSSTSEVGGEISSLAYSRMTFQVLDKSTITIEEAVDDEDDFETIQLTIFNDGNVEDNIIVELVNYDELDDLGIGYAFFSESPLYVGVDSYRESVAPGATSNAGKMIFGIDELPDEDISFEIELLAYSSNDDDTEPVKVTVDVVIAGGGSSALGLDSVSSSDLKLIGMAGGGLIGVIVLLVMISRLTKKATGKQKVAAKEAKKAAKLQRKGRKPKKAKVVEEEYDDDDDFDFDDFDDDFDFEDL